MVLFLPFVGCGIVQPNSELARHCARLVAVVCPDTTTVG